MYGTEATDPVVRYYDQTLAVTPSNDIAWYVDRARSSDGRVLDLACGTGRISMPLARVGLDVTAVDNSRGMLQLFRRKLSAEAPYVQSRISIHQARMQSFELPDKFASIVCCDAFFHNLTVDDQISCLLRVARHLVPGGRFAFDIPNPTVGLLGYAASQEANEFTRRDEYPLAGSEHAIFVEQAYSADLLQQTVTTRLRFTRLNAKREPVAIETSSWTSRFIYRYEAVHLLCRCGFETESLTGGYRGGPVTEDGQLVFVARLRKRA